MIDTHSESATKLSIGATGNTLPLAIAVTPWGVLTGALAMQVGLSSLQGLRGYQQ